MSINVTVTGHPISVKRGRIISTDYNSNGDFQKRRKIRLEQVRQQSKNIAENVRNRVKRAKSKETGDIEREGQLKLQEWQNKKLQGLQNQYRECIKDIGLGHTQAIIEEAEENAFIEDQDRTNNEKAIERGIIATEKLKQTVPESKKKPPKVISPVKQKRVGRKGDVENYEDIKKSNVEQGASPKNIGRDINVKNKNNFPVDEVNNGECTDVSYSTGNTSPRLSPTKEPQPFYSPTKLSQAKTLVDSLGSCKALSSLKEFEVFGSNFGSYEGTAVALGGKKCEDKSAKIMDNRISERIKNRRLNTNVENIASYSKEITNDTKCKSCERHNNEKFISEPLNQDNSYSQKCSCCKFCNVGPPVVSCNCKCNQLSLENDNMQSLPTKRTVSLRTTDTLKSNHKKEYNKVHYYDHSNRFNKEILIDNGNMRKISNDSIEVCINSDGSEAALEEINLRHEKESHYRGKQAIRKEMLQKQFKELMEKLPILQKQERIASFNPKKDKFHYSQSRLKEREKKDQEKLEKAFEQLVPNVITIENKSGEGSKKQKMFWRDFEDDDEDERLKKGKKKNHQKKSKESVLSDESSLDDETSLCNNANDNVSVRKLLEKLKKQKELLLKEKNNLPSTSNLLKLIKNLDVDDEKVSRKKSKTKTPIKKKFSKEGGNFSSPNDKTSSKSSKQSLTSTSSDLKKSTPKIKKPSTPCSPLQKQRDKHKLRREVLILQNMSTQTSPVAPPKTVDSNPDTRKSKKSEESEKVCEILIKIQENDKTDIEVKNPQKVVSNESKDLSSWKHQLTKNDTNYTSSTSYYSPPDFGREKNLKQLITQKPQQLNLNYYKNDDNNKEKHGNKNIDPRLLTLVRKLLQMSKGSIENLHVSGVSEVSTPSASVINIATNYESNKVNKNILRSIDVLDNRIIKEAEKTTKTIMNENALKMQQIKTNENNKLIRDLNSTNINISQKTEFNTLQQIKNQSQQTSFDDEEINYPEIAQQYSKIASSCQKRIKNLSELIQQVRTEQKQMLSPTNTSDSEKENSMTHYYNLPSVIEPEVFTDERSQQKQLTEKLLEINLKETNQPSGPKQIDNTDIDPEIINRYLKLLNDKSSEQDTEVDSSAPLMLDIPKLPKLQQTNNENNHTHKRPPTAKIIKKLDIQPHELSTIHEADSIRNKSKSPESRKTSPSKQISNDVIDKLQTDIPKNKNEDFKNLVDKLLTEHTKKIRIISKSPNNSMEESTALTQPKVNVLEMHSSKSTDKKTKIISFSQPNTENSKELDVSEVLKKLHSVSTDTSSEKSDLDVETMLRTIGLDWAVATARKTQEALAQHSSSSSGKLSGSPLTLPNKPNISTSTSKSDTNISPYLQEFNNISSICANGTVENHQRTSTPVNNETTKKSEQPLFTGESEMSSVQEKQASDEQFVSLLNNSPNDTTDDFN